MIGVCLKFENKNYGSKLQALATIRKFEELGMKFEIIHYNKRGLWFKIKSIPRLFNPIFLQDKKELKKRQFAFNKHPEIKKKIELRNRYFNEYDEKYFNHFQVICDYFSDLKKQAYKYNAVITCSDQLWSPAGLSTNFYNLMFVPDKIKKISFASSFGVSKIPWYQYKRTRKYLNRIEHISVRENSGQKIVYDLTGKIVPVLLDPVFAFDKKEWDKIVPPKTIYNFPYIFCYFLGTNVMHRKVVKTFAQDKGLKIVSINHLNNYVEYDNNFADYAPYDINPNDFLNLIRSAEFVCTDSFHGTAFAIINEKQFVVFNRYSDHSSISKNSRIDTICDILELNHRRVNEETNLDEILPVKIDYQPIKGLLQVYKQKMTDYLNKSFKESK